MSQGGTPGPAMRTALDQTGAGAPCNKQAEDEQPARSAGSCLCQRQWRLPSSEGAEPEQGRGRTERLRQSGQSRGSQRREEGGPEPWGNLWGGGGRPGPAAPRGLNAGFTAWGPKCQQGQAWGRAAGWREGPADGGLAPAGKGAQSRGGENQPQPGIRNWEQPSVDILTTFQCSNCSSFWIFLICSIVLEQKQLSRTQVADRPLRPEFQLQSEAGTRTWQLREAEGGPGRAPDEGLSPRGPLGQGDEPTGGPFQRHLSWSPEWSVLPR